VRRRPCLDAPHSDRVLLTQRRFYREPPSVAASYARFQSAGSGAACTPAPEAPARRLASSGSARYRGRFIVLYVTDISGVFRPCLRSPIRHSASRRDRLVPAVGARSGPDGRTPLVALTFVFFALFPLAIQPRGAFRARGRVRARWAQGGGEPARKSLILDLADPGSRGRAVVSTTP